MGFSQSAPVYRHTYLDKPNEAQMSKYHCHANKTRACAALKKQRSSALGLYCSKTHYVVCVARKHVMLSVQFKNTLCCLCSSKTRYVVWAVRKHVTLSVQFKNTLCCQGCSKIRYVVCAVRKHVMLSVQFENT